MKPRLYIETTIPSYLTSRPSRDIITAGHQQTTKLWWEKRKDKFEIFISQLVLDEASQGDPNAAAERLSILAEVLRAYNSGISESACKAILARWRNSGKGFDRCCTHRYLRNT